MYSKKPLIVFLSLVLAAAIFVVGFTRLFVPSLVGAMLYRGPRLVVEIYVSVDGKNTAVKKADDTNSVVKNKDGYDVLTAKINECGYFEYKLDVDGMTVTLNGYHFEWWEVIESTLYLDINTEAQTYTVSENYFHTMQNNFFFCHRVTEKEYPRTFEGLDDIKTNIGS